MHVSSCICIGELTSPCYLGLKSHRVRTGNQWTLHLKAPLHMSDKGFLSGCTQQKKKKKAKTPKNKFKVIGLPNKYISPSSKKLNSSSQRSIFLWSININIKMYSILLVMKMQPHLRHHNVPTRTRLAMPGVGEDAGS